MSLWHSAEYVADEERGFQPPAERCTGMNYPEWIQIPGPRSDANIAPVSSGWSRCISDH
jgi:hypothetical protein